MAHFGSSSVGCHCRAFEKEDTSEAGVPSPAQATEAGSLKALLVGALQQPVLHSDQESASARWAGPNQVGAA